MNGNVTADGKSFFIGVNKLSVEIGNLGGNMTDINGNITFLANNASAIATNAGTARTDVRKVPNNADADGNPTISYTIPFDTAYSAGKSTINSGYPAILGSSGNGGVIGALYTASNQLYTTLNSISTSSSGFTGSSSSFGTAVTSIRNTIDGFKNNLNDLDSSMKGALAVFDTPK